MEWLGFEPVTTEWKDADESTELWRPPDVPT